MKPTASPFLWSLAVLTTLATPALGHNYWKDNLPVNAAKLTAPHIHPFYHCAVNYYVSKAGSDTTGNGSATRPWLTISHAVAVLKSRGGIDGGVCVNVEPGIYTETVNAGALSGSSDTPTGYFVLRSTRLHQAIIQEPKGIWNYACGIRFENAQYIVVDGFDLVGRPVRPNIDGSGIYVDGSSASVPKCNHIIILNNISHGWGGSGLGFDHTDYVEVEGNVVYGTCNTSTWGVTAINFYEPVARDDKSWNPRTVGKANAVYHNIIGSNIAYDNAEVNIGNNPHWDGNGITLDTFNAAKGYHAYTPKTVVENNLCFGNGGAGITTGGPGASNVTIRNNTCFDDYLDQQNKATVRGEICIAGRGDHDDIVINNIAVANPHANVHNVAFEDFGFDGYQNAHNVWENNLSFNGTIGDPSIVLHHTTSTITAAHGNILGRNPLFIDPRRGNFALQAHSPARPKHIGAHLSFYGSRR